MEIVWKTHPVYPWYSVSSNGDIIGPRGTLMKWQFNRKNSYYWVKIQLRDPNKAYVRTMYVHDLVCTTFHGDRPKGLEVRHLDGDRSNNSESNLCWGTHAENSQDMIRHGRNVGGRRKS